MKQEEKLLRAIGGVDDELVAEAMEYRQAPRHRGSWLRWTAVAACVCLLLTVTVGAAKWGVEWWHGTDERHEQYTVDWRYPLEPVTIRQEAHEELEKWLQWGWGVDGRNEEYGNRAMWPDSYYVGAYLSGVDKVRTISDLEDYLGLDLATSPGIDGCCETIWEEAQASGDDQPRDAVSVIALSELIADAEIEYAETGEVSLGGILVEMHLGYLGTNCKTGMKIFIAQTQDFADGFPAEEWWSAVVSGPTWSDYEDGKFEVEELTISGKEVVIFSTPVDDLDRYPTALAVYCEDGIGYYIYCTAENWEGSETHQNVYQHGRERLMELLEGLE